MMFDNQLEIHVIDMSSSVKLASLKGSDDLSEKSVERGSHFCN